MAAQITKLVLWGAFGTPILRRGGRSVVSDDTIRMSDGGLL